MCKIQKLIYEETKAGMGNVLVYVDDKLKDRWLDAYSVSGNTIWVKLKLTKCECRNN